MSWGLETPCFSLTFSLAFLFHDKYSLCSLFLIDNLVLDKKKKVFSKFYLDRVLKMNLGLSSHTS